MGVRPRRTGPAEGKSVAEKADSNGGAPRARREEEGGEEESRMNVSRDGGGNMGRDIARSEADNLWVDTIPGDLKAQWAMHDHTLPHGRMGKRGRPFPREGDTGEPCNGASRVPA